MSRQKLLAIHRALDACHACSGVVGPSVHGPALDTDIVLVGQAPGVHEAGIGRPFAWTAGKTLFRWLESATGLGEKEIRERVYFTAVARCFPGKAKGGGDRPPSRDEVSACRPFLAGEVQALRPRLVLAVGTHAIREVLGACPKLEDIIGTEHRVTWHGVSLDVIPLPHPSGASPWPKIEPGKTLLAEALGRVAIHPAILAARHSSAVGSGPRNASRPGTGGTSSVRRSAAAR